MLQQRHCPDCELQGLASPDESLNSSSLDRRRFVQGVGAIAAAALLPRVLNADDRSAATAATPSDSEPEVLVRRLYESLTEVQQDEVCFAWDHTDDRGLLRTHVSNNWFITDRKLNVGSDFFSADQRDMIEALFFGLYEKEWHPSLRKQLQDDAGGYGKQQTIAIFGEPGKDKFEFVMTGRHLTIRCDGNSTEHMAFGGPIFYGHAAQGFNEAPDHPGNVYWAQALKANALYSMLDGNQRKQALVANAPGESKVEFKGAAAKEGIALSELSGDQKSHVRGVLDLLLQPYRSRDREEVMQCLDRNGGLDACHIAFYQSGDLGNDQVWDNWRLEGPAFVWHFRGTPHVHVWVNIADSANVALNAKG